MARRRVRGTTRWCQPLLPGLAAQLVAPTGGQPAPPPLGVANGDSAAADAWEERCFREACRLARQLAVTALAALEGELHVARPRGCVVEGWRERTVVTRFGDVRVRRRLYTAPDGTAHFLLDEHLGWPARQVATPAFAQLLVEWAADVPFRVAARRVAQATAGAVGGSTVWRLLQQVATRALAHERAVHATWATTAALPLPEGERVVPALYVEADGVWVKTQREPAHTSGYELKCASAYEGWDCVADPTPGHPRAHYRLREKQVYCHGHTRADARAPLPFWDGVSLALSRTYNLARVPVMVVGGDGANWLDTALEHFPQAVRQRDGFHLARDAARGWGPAAGATLYQAVRAGDQATALDLLALPPPAVPARAVALLPPPAAEATGGSRSGPRPQPGSQQASSRRSWSPQQIQQARATVTAQVATPDAAVDWRRQVPPDLVPADARALGTQEGTNAHLLAKRTKHKGMAWSCPGARSLAKVRELVTNGALAPWCHRPPTPATGAPRPRPACGFAPPGPLPWPQTACPAVHGPASDPTAAVLHRIDTGGRSPHRLT